MPNWVNNDFTVTGPKEEIDKFRDDAVNEMAKTELCLNNLFPMPDELENTVSPARPETDEEKIKSRELIRKYGSDNWYDWKVKNWGTKWDVEARLPVNETKKLVYVFESAWSPPVNWMVEVSKKYPLLKFKMKYVEEGNGFKGICYARKGKVKEKGGDWE